MTAAQILALTLLSFGDFEDFSIDAYYSPPINICGFFEPYPTTQQCTFGYESSDSTILFVTKSTTNFTAENIFQDHYWELDNIATHSWWVTISGAQGSVFFKNTSNGWACELTWDSKFVIEVCADLEAGVDNSLRLLTIRAMQNE